MEKYKISNLLTPIKLGEFKELVYNKHISTYGKDGADGILNTAKKIFKEVLKQESNAELSNNSLLVGKVQSGKTSNLEMLTAIAFDNDFNLMIIYGGYDSYLLQQTVNRFSDTFDYNNDRIHIISTDGDISLYDDNFFDTAIEEGKPVIITAMKRPAALSKVNTCLKKIHKAALKTFIIDDEGDQASLNTEKNKEEDASATYKQICIMKEILKNPLYFSVTATPQANIFQNDISKLRPDSIHLIKPGNGYAGAEVFHFSENNIVTIDDKDINLLDNGVFASSLKNAVNIYLISSAIMRMRKILKSDMIVHTYREINGHMILHGMIEGYINNLKDNINNNNDDDFEIDLKGIKSVYNNKFFNQNIIDKVKWDESLLYHLKKVIKSCVVIQQNSKNSYDEKVLKSFNNIIYIGGDLLQRGITFKRLVTTYFTRWSLKGNMDTSLQRARWFGYRNEYLDLCKVFVTKTIKKEFSTLAEIESDLWSQFELIGRGEMTINDIVIDANETSLNPTRKNVADYKKIKFTKKWNNQREISLDSNIVNYNNQLVEQLLKKYKFSKESSVGRLDGKTSTFYEFVDASDFIELIQKSKHIFEQSPFTKTDLINLLSKEKTICVEFLTSFGNLIKVRERTVDNNKILALQQGADSTDKDKIKYQGDSYVIVKNDMITIQVFKILPIVDEKKSYDFQQYMFAIHFPKKTIVYAKK